MSNKMLIKFVVGTMFAITALLSLLLHYKVMDEHIKKYTPAMQSKHCKKC